MKDFDQLFDDNMSSRQIAMIYFRISDTVTGDEQKKLDTVFRKASMKAKKRELQNAFAVSNDGVAYMTQ